METVESASPVGDIDDPGEIGEFFLEGGVLVFQQVDAREFFFVGPLLFVQLQQLPVHVAQVGRQEADVGQAALVIAVGLDHLRQQRGDGQQRQNRQHDSEPFNGIFLHHMSPAPKGPNIVKI